MRKIKNISFNEFMRDVTKYSSNSTDMNKEYQFKAAYKFIKEQNENAIFNPKDIKLSICTCSCPNGLPDNTCVKNNAILSLNESYDALQLENKNECLLINKDFLKDLKHNKNETTKRCSV